MIPLKKIFLIYVEKFIYKFSYRSKSHDILKPNVALHVSLRET